MLPTSGGGAGKSDCERQSSCLSPSFDAGVVWMCNRRVQCCQCHIMISWHEVGLAGMVQPLTVCRAQTAASAPDCCQHRLSKVR